MCKKKVHFFYNLFAKDLHMSEKSSTFAGDFEIETD